MVKNKFVDWEITFLKKCVLIRVADSEKSKTPEKVGAKNKCGSN